MQITFAFGRFGAVATTPANSVTTEMNASLASVQNKMRYDAQ